MYTPIDQAEIATGKPVKKSLWQKVKDNFDYIFGATSADGMVNGSFEQDTDADGIPDNWTRYLYPGGSAAFETASPEHGGKSYAFTHPGGAGNGGGYLESGYIEVSEMRSYYLAFTVRSTAVGIKNIVEVLYYDAAKVYISTTQLYNATAPDTNAATRTYKHTPPAGARFYKVRCIGGYTDTDVAGTTYFDGVKEGYVSSDMTAFDLPVERGLISLTMGVWTTLKAATIYTGGLYSISFSTYKDADNVCNAQVFIDDVAAGTLRVCPGFPGATAAEYVTFTEDIFIGGGQTVQLKVMLGGGVGLDYIYVRDFFGQLKFASTLTVADANA